MTRPQQIAVGDRLPEVTFGPITRTTLALFAGASGDHNPIHIDIDFARSAGIDDVFAHGMLPMAVLGRVLSNWAPLASIRRFGVRFTSITRLGATVRCTGVVSDIRKEDNERRAYIDLSAQTEAGQTLIGSAVIAIDH